MSSEVALSPTKKIKQKMEQQQIVSSDVTNGCSDIVDETVNQQALINSNINDTNNKDCHVDVCMEPLLIQDCVDDQFYDDATNPINETNCVLSDTSDSPNDPISVCDILSAASCNNNNKDNELDDKIAATAVDSGGGGDCTKANLNLNLNNETNEDDNDRRNLPKNKKFLDSTDDELMNQIFFQTITVTPTTEDDELLLNGSSKYLCSDNTPSDIDSDLIVGPVDFFNRKIDEDEAFDTTYTDTIDNYQENEDGNLCSLNDNFNENYCSFSSIDYNTTNIQLAQENNNEEGGEKTPENDLLQPDTFLGGYAEQMRKQRPSIVIDCYDSDSKTEEEDVVIADEKINDYCFYFDQTIEEDDDDGCFNVSDANDSLSEATHVKDNHNNDDEENELEKNDVEITTDENNGKALDVQGEENDKDECFETEEDEMFNDGSDEESSNDDKSTASDDEGVINESCLSVNSAIESFESESTVVKKTVKKSVKTTKSSKKTVSTTESSSITSSKAESFENSISNGSIEKIEQKQQKVIAEQQKKSITSNGISAKTVQSTEIIEQGNHIDEKSNNKNINNNNHQQEQVETNGIEKKRGTSGKKKSKKKKSESEKENISVNTSTSMQQSMSIVCSQPVVKTTIAPIISNHTHNSNNHIYYNNINDVQADDIDCHKSLVKDNSMTSSTKSNNSQKFIMSSSFQLHEDDLSKIDVKSLKQKYSNAIEKQSMKSSLLLTGANSTGYLSIRKDISVKHLCRSFGDLSSLNNEEYNTNYFQHVYRTKSVCDLRKLEHLPIYTGVSVRNLRDSYCSLIGLTDINNLQQQHQQPHSFAFKRSINSIKSSCRGKIINLGIKQFDMKSSFSKFDALQKKNLQSFQNGKSGENGVSPDAEKKCNACDKVVFQMEQIKAEKKFWHRSCFRCAECNKQLNVDTYQSHEGILYCKPHFKSLFAPKVVEENNEPVKPRKHEMIILENQPIELPPDVVRSSDKADLGLDELHQINLRQRFQLFENAGQQESTKVELDKGSSVKRSTSILSKLARFQAKGMDVGVVDDSLNGISYENSSSGEEEDEDDDENNEDIELIRAKRAQKEKPMSFKEMYDIKSKFESGQLMSKEERREERKQELQNIRSRLFMGKQAKIKEMYQQAVAESEQTITSSGKASDFEISDKAKSIKEKFEKGEIYDENDMKRTLKEEEMAVFEKGIGKQSRSLFLELDATAAKSPIQESPSSANLRPASRQTPRQNSQTIVSNDDIVRSDQKVDDVQIETADIVSKFKFFETYKPPEQEKKSFRITPPRDYQGLTKLPSPEKEVYRDPHIVRNEKRATDQDEILELQKTTSKVLSMFRQMEETKPERPVGPKPLKRFTPPPEGERNRYMTNDDSGPEYSDDGSEGEECSEEESDEEEQEQQDPNYIKSSHKNVDEFLKAAQSAERAKKLREKFEKWEENEIKKEMNNSSVNLYEEAQDEGQMETAKSLKARFEQMQNEEPKLPTNRPIRVNRFV